MCRGRTTYRSYNYKTYELYTCGLRLLCDGSINAEKYIRDFEQHMLPSQSHECFFFSQQDHAKPEYA